MTLLYRAVIQRTHHDLKRKLKVSGKVYQLLSLLVGEGSALSEDDEDEIEYEGRNGPHGKAVDLLLFKLMQLKHPDWFEGFLTGLKQVAPTLVPVVTDARDKLQQEHWFVSISVVPASQGENSVSGTYQ